MSDSPAVVPLFSFSTPMNPKKYRLICFTQTYENYSDDPVGAPYWKPKFGSDYLVAELTLEQAQRGQEYLANAVACAKPYIEADNAMYREHVIGWHLLAPGEMTESERMQLEYEGRVIYSPTSVTELQRRARVEKYTLTKYLPHVSAESSAPIRREIALNAAVVAFNA